MFVYQLLPHQNDQLKPPLKRMDAAPVPYENVKDNFEVEVAAANGENGDRALEEEDPFRTDHVEVQKLVSLQAPDSPAVPLRRRKVVVAEAAFGRGFCVYRKVTRGVRSCPLSFSRLLHAYCNSVEDFVNQRVIHSTSQKPFSLLFMSNYAFHKI